MRIVPNSPCLPFRPTADRYVTFLFYSLFRGFSEMRYDVIIVHARTFIISDVARRTAIDFICTQTLYYITIIRFPHNLPKVAGAAFIHLAENLS